MRLKLDENLPVEAAELLREAGHDATTVLEQDMGGESDPNVAAVCLHEARVLVTFDLHERYGRYHLPTAVEPAAAGRRRASAFSARLVAGAYTAPPTLHVVRPLRLSGQLLSAFCHMVIRRAQPGDEALWAEAIQTLVAEEDRVQRLAPVSPLARALPDARCYLFLALFETTGGELEGETCAEYAWEFKGGASPAAASY